MMGRRKHPKPYVHVQRAKYGNVHGGLQPRGVVLHSTESHDRPGNSDVEGVLRYLENTPDRLGIHFVVDAEGRVGQGAYTNRLVYHARGANSSHIGIEMIGFARFSVKQWRLRRKQLRKVAMLLAWLHVKYGIPLRRDTWAGVALHRDYPAGGHWDPGYGFPIRSTLRKARRLVKSGWGHDK